MKSLLIAVLATMLAAPALAATHSIPADNPLVTVVVPDKGWKATKIARGIEVGDEDDEVYLSIEAIDGSNAAETGAAAVGYLNRQGVTLDPSTKTETEGKMGDFQMSDMGWKGKDKDGDVIVHITIVTVTAQRGILFTYWASPKGDKQHDAANRGDGPEHEEGRELGSRRSLIPAALAEAGAQALLKHGQK